MHYSSLKNPLKYLTLLLLVLPALCLADALSSVPDPQPSAAAQAMIVDLGLRESRVPVREMPGWVRPKKAVIRVFSPDQIAGLKAAAPDVEIVFVENMDQAIAEVSDAQLLIGFCDELILSQAPQLHWVQVFWAGVEDCVSHAEMRKGDKLLTNGQSIGSPALAEHAIAMMMMLVRGLDVYHSNQLQGIWQRNPGIRREQFMELDGRTVLIVGLGGIGRQTAKRAHGLGMRVIATRGSRREGPDYVDYVGLADEALELAEQADVVINTAPLTEQTKGMFNAAFFAAMKPSAYFVSVGRGGSTVTTDLVAALETGAIAGAGLDVTDPEPLPEGHVLWTTPRVIISPHTGGRSDKGLERLFLLLEENLRRYVAGEAMLSVVDIDRGY